LSEFNVKVPILWVGTGNLWDRFGLTKRCQGVPREEHCCVHLVQKELCIEFTASAVMRQSLHLKMRGYVVAITSLWGRVGDILVSFQLQPSLL